MLENDSALVIYTGSGPPWHQRRAQRAPITSATAHTMLKKRAISEFLNDGI